MGTAELKEKIRENAEKNQRRKIENIESMLKTAKDAAVVGNLKASLQEATVSLRRLEAARGKYTG